MGCSGIINYNTIIFSGYVGYHVMINYNTLIITGHVRYHVMINYNTTILLGHLSYHVIINYTTTILSDHVGYHDILNYNKIILSGNVRYHVVINYVIRGFNCICFLSLHMCLSVCDPYMDISSVFDIVVQSTHICFFDVVFSKMWRSHKYICLYWIYDCAFINVNMLSVYYSTQYVHHSGLGFYPI